MLDQAPDLVVDACTLNNALNAVQLAILVALLRWVHGTTRS